MHTSNRGKETGCGIGILATRKPPCEREIEIDHKFLARRWVIYARIHVEVSGNQDITQDGSCCGRRWKTHLNFFLGARAYFQYPNTDTPFHVTTHACDVATQDRYGASDSQENTICGKIRNLTFDAIVSRTKLISPKYC